MSKILNFYLNLLLQQQQHHSFREKYYVNGINEYFIAQANVEEEKNVHKKRRKIYQFFM